MLMPEGMFALVPVGGERGREAPFEAELSSSSGRTLRAPVSDMLEVDKG
jgi:hypothetical protein